MKKVINLKKNHQFEKSHQLKKSHQFEKAGHFRKRSTALKKFDNFEKHPDENPGKSGSFGSKKSWERNRELVS